MNFTKPPDYLAGRFTARICTRVWTGGYPGVVLPATRHGAGVYPYHQLEFVIQIIHHYQQVQYTIYTKRYL